MPKIALVVNEPPPYRIPVFNRIAARADVDLQVIFCCRREPNRQWDLPPIAFQRVFLHERITTVNGRYIHNNPDVMIALSRFNPDVVVGNGFNPTHLYAMIWCIVRRRPYIPMTDGTLQSEKTLGRWHRALRRKVYRSAPAFIAASHGGLALYRHYGVAPQQCHLSCLCIDNDRFRRPDGSVTPEHDFIFCARLEAGKNPAFAIDVAARCAERLGRRTRLLMVGSGSLDGDLHRLADSMKERVDLRFHGFATQTELPSLYQSARIFLFPTQADVWGVVANEACAAGLPVLVSPHAGVAGELVIDGHNGFVLPLDPETWADAAALLLTNEGKRSAFGQRSLLKVAPYNFSQAAQGIVDACHVSAASRTRHRGREHPASPTANAAITSAANQRHQRPMV